jgi:glutamate mutase epsilon subunit
MAIWNAIGAIDKALKVLTVTEGVLKMTDNQEPTGKEKRTFKEEIELEGRQLVDRVKELLREGNVRKLSVKDADGKYLLEIPLTVGVVAGGVFMLYAPVAAALGAIAGLLANVKIEIVREVDDDDPPGDA